MKTLVDLGGMESPRPLALKSDIMGYYTRLGAIETAIEHVEQNIGTLSDKGGHIKWANITGKPAATLTNPGVVTLSNNPSPDKTNGATLSSLRTANSDGLGFVPTDRCVNGIALKGDITLGPDDIWTFSKSDVDAMAAVGGRVKAVRLGTPVQTAYNAVPINNYITSFYGPGQPVWSRPLQFLIQRDDGSLKWTDIRRTA